jgi:tetratricopeptide (TPR) repeat protein
VTPLRPRVDRAVAEGRFQHALELAKQLYKTEPTPDHLDLLKTTYLGRARQLRGSGYDRDATTTLDAAVRIDPANPAWLEQLATELAACGAVGRAVELLKQVPSPSVGSAVFARAADAAVQHEAAGRASLPPEMHAEFDRILKAFQQVQTGEDEAARETLQGIGLRSPFLEWKLFLRGLQAYYQNDDPRAVENWGRLSPERLPARLAAPFRARLDRSFRNAQTPDTQGVLRSQLDRLQGSALAEQLRGVRAALADSETRTFAAAFRQVEALLPAMRQEAPHLLPRLAACCYWALAETGPDDTLRYKRVFGPPPDDPHFRRLEALACERYGDPERAHKAWQEYEKEIAEAPPAVWPPELAPRARALIWLRMGKNAAEVPSAKKLAKVPRHLRDATDWPDPLRPGAEHCFEQCLKLAPDLLEAHEALFRFHQEEGHAAKAEKAARRLLQRFPDHVATLTALGQLLHRDEKYPEALEFYQRALKANPLKRELRQYVSTVHVGCARLLLEAGRYDEGRAHLRSALAFNDDPDDSPIRCRWSALEFRAGNPDEAEAQLREARVHAGADLPVSYRMLTECARLKLDKKLKARFDKEVKEGLTAPPTPAAVVGLVGCAASLKAAGFDYYGQKTHEKKVQTYADKGRGADFSRAQMVTVTKALAALEGWTAAQRYAEAGEKKFKSDPEFPVLLARLLLRHDGRRSMPAYRVRPVLARAERLVRELPKEDERKERLTQEIAAMQSTVQLLDPYGGLEDYGGFPDVFDSFFEDEEDEDEY